MASEVCPPDYTANLRACFLFGTHMSYDGASALCETDGARLVDIDSINNKYVRDRVKLAGGNDFWIGSYLNKGGNPVRRKGTTGCPMMRGQDTGNGFFAQVNCNSAYPFICQKYGERPKKTNRPNQNRFPNEQRPVRFGADDYDEEVENEIAITTAPRKIQTSAAVKGNNSNQVIAALVSVVVLIVLAILIRIYFKRKNANKRRQEKELERKLTAAGNVTKNPHAEKQGSDFQRTMSRTTTLKSTASSVHKPFTLPSSTNMTSQLNRRTPAPVEDYVDKRVQSPYASKYERSRSNKSRHHEDTVYHQRRRETPSPERSLHGTHTHTPPYGRSRRQSLVSRNDVYNRSQRNYGRSRSYSRRRSSHDGNKCGWMSRSSSLDSTVSDSAMSRATSFRHSRRGREISRDNQSYYHDDDDRRSFRRQSSNRASGHRYKSLYERYAASQLPMPAHEAMARNPVNNDMGNYYRRSMRRNQGEQDRKYYADPRQRPSSYFPQMTNVLNWSNEDINNCVNDAAFSHHFNKRGRSLMPTQHPIRVNRHIHDFQSLPTPDHDNRRISDPSKDVDHVYESLDEVARTKNGK